MIVAGIAVVVATLHALGARTDEGLEDQVMNEAVSPAAKANLQVPGLHWDQPQNATT